jgi:hypothetical protein
MLMEACLSQYWQQYAAVLTLSLLYGVTERVTERGIEE